MRSEGGGSGEGAMDDGEGDADAMQQEEEAMVDADGFVTVRRSTRRKTAPKFYDPSVTFPGAE